MYQKRDLPTYVHFGTKSSKVRKLKNLTSYGCIVIWHETAYRDQNLLGLPLRNGVLVNVVSNYKTLGSFRGWSLPLLSVRVFRYIAENRWVKMLCFHVSVFKKKLPGLCCAINKGKRRQWVIARWSRSRKMESLRGRMRMDEIVGCKWKPKIVPGVRVSSLRFDWGWISQFSRSEGFEHSKE